MPRKVRRAARAALALPTLSILLAGSLLVAGEARAEPVKCRIGAYVASLSQVDTAATFAVVLSFVSVEKLVGPHDGVYLLDQLHFATLALIMAATGLGVISLRTISQGGDAARQRRMDLRGAVVLLGAYLLLNLILILIGLAIADAKG